MANKLTLTIARKTLLAAKKYADERGISLSRLVENYLISIALTEYKEKKISMKISRLMGVIKLPKNYNYESDLADQVFKKYMK